MIPKMRLEYVEINVVELLGIDVTGYLDYSYDNHWEEDRPEPMTVRALLREVALSRLGKGIPNNAEVNVDFDSEETCYAIAVAWLEWGNEDD